MEHEPQIYPKNKRKFDQNFDAIFRKPKPILSQKAAGECEAFRQLMEVCTRKRVTFKTVKIASRKPSSKYDLDWGWDKRNNKGK